MRDESADFGFVDRSGHLVNTSGVRQTLRTHLTKTFKGDLFEAVEGGSRGRECGHLAWRRTVTINPESFRGWPHRSEPDWREMALLQRLIPKRIKIKPIVRRNPGVMLETIDITLRPMLDVFGATVAIQDYFLGESLKNNFVAVASMIEAKE